MNRFRVIVTKDWGIGRIEMTVDAPRASRAIGLAKLAVEKVAVGMFNDGMAVTLIGSTDDFMTEVWVNPRSGAVTKFAADRCLTEDGMTV